MLENTKLRPAIITFGVICLILIGWAIYHAVTVKGKVTFYLAPMSGVTLDINGKIHKNVSTEAKLSVTDTNLTITASREGFATATSTYTLSNDGSANTVYITLRAESDDAKQLMATAEEVANLQFVATEKSLKTAEKIHTMNPILSKLPHTETYFTLSQGVSEEHPEKEEAFALYVDYITERGKTDAINYLKSQGANPDDYEIIYRAENYTTRAE